MRYYYLTVAAAATARNLQWDDPAWDTAGGWGDDMGWDDGSWEDDWGHDDMGHWEDDWGNDGWDDNSWETHDPCDKHQFEKDMNEMRSWGMSETDIKMMWDDFDRMCSGADHHGGWEDDKHWDDGTSGHHDDMCDKHSFEMQMNEMRSWGLPESDIDMMWKDWENMCYGDHGGKHDMPDDWSCDPAWAEQKLHEAMAEGVPQHEIDAGIAQWEQMCGEGHGDDGSDVNHMLHAAHDWIHQNVGGDQINNGAMVQWN